MNNATKEPPPLDIEPRPTLPTFTYLVLPFLVVSLCDALRLKYPGVGLRLAVVCGLAALFIYAILVRYDTGDDLQNNASGTAFASMFFNAAALLLFQDPLKDCRWEVQREDSAAMSLWKRVYWSLCIQTNTRGIGWNYQVDHLPTTRQQTHLQFVWTRIIRIALHLLLADVLGVYADCNAAIFGQSGHAARSLRSQGFVLALCNSVAFMGMSSYCTNSIYYDILGIVMVGGGLSEPKYWPPPCGRWKDAYTIRRFWGRTWHQMMRRFVSTIGKATSRLLGFAPGTWLSSRAQLIVGFTISGLAHIPGDAMVHPYWTGSSFWFFLYNALAIVLEDFVIDMGRRAGVKDGRAVRTFGYVWTIAWFTYATPWFLDWQIAAGLGGHRMLSWSVVKPALGYLTQATGVDVLGWVTRQCASR